MNKNNKRASSSTYKMPDDFHPYQTLDGLLGGIKALHLMYAEGTATHEPLDDETFHALLGLIDTAYAQIQQFHRYFLAIEDLTSIRLPRNNEDFAAHSIGRHDYSVREQAASYGPIHH